MQLAPINNYTFPRLTAGAQYSMPAPTAAEPGESFTLSTTDLPYHYNTYTFTDRQGSPMELQIRLPEEKNTHHAWYDDTLKDLVYHPETTSTVSPNGPAPLWDFLISPKA